MPTRWSSGTTGSAWIPRTPRRSSTPSSACRMPPITRGPDSAWPSCSGSSRPTREKSSRGAAKAWAPKSTSSCRRGCRLFHSRWRCIRKVGSRKSEVGSRKWEVGSGKWEVGSGKSEVGSGKSEVGSGKSEVGSGKWEVGSGKWEVGSRKWEVGSRKWEVGSRKWGGTATILWVSRDFPEGPLERFLEDLAALGVPGSSRGILIAVSGGADSTALCRLLSAAREREGRRGSWPALWVGHVHHGLRGEEADADLAFTRELAESLGLGFLEARADVRALARGRGLSIEAAARSARYAVFAGWARDHDLDDLVLGHTASDQAETVLLRVLRRAGLRGLRGMPRERPLCFHQPGPRPRIVRPLLSWTRAEILDYLTALGQHHREDSSNLDP